MFGALPDALIDDQAPVETVVAGVLRPMIA